METTVQAGHNFPVSVKGVLLRDDQALLLKNDRDEWELPGGKLELGEEPQACVAREIAEETGLAVTAGPILDAWQYHIREGSDVVIITYGCRQAGDSRVRGFIGDAALRTPVVSSEHSEIGFFSQADVAHLKMPAGYKRSITAWFARAATEH